MGRIGKSVAFIGVTGFCFEIFWLLMWFPKYPKTRQGWLAWHASGALLWGAMVACGFYSEWVESHKNVPRRYLFWKTIGVLVVGAFGVAFLGGVIVFSGFITENFTYRSDAHG